jgi:hypothetical protein
MNPNVQVIGSGGSSHLSTVSSDDTGLRLNSIVEEGTAILHKQVALNCITESLQGVVKVPSISIFYVK